MCSNTYWKARSRWICILWRGIGFSQQPWRGSSTIEPDSRYMSKIIAAIALWKIRSAGETSVILRLRPTRTSTNFDHQSSSSIRNQIRQNIPAVMKYRISVTRVQKKSIQWVQWHTLLALSPVRSLSQIARRRRTSRIFTTDEFNVVENLLTLAAVVLKSQDETHSTDTALKRHLVKRLEQVTKTFDLYH